MKLIILDRDGVINQDPVGYIKDPADWHPYPGSLQAIKLLNDAGLLVTVASNQSGIGRGFFTEEDLNRVHQKFHHELSLIGAHIDGIYCCVHHPNEGCTCRKPEIGLLQQMQAQHHIAPHEMLFIGDSACDLETSARFGCQRILVLTGNGKKTQTENAAYQAVETYDDLLQAAQAILRKLE